MEESSNKKSPFDDLSKDELIKKCKAMLIIAQKAKQAKTEINNECDALKENCKKMEIQKVADKESLKTMQEYIDNLTAQNLQYATDIDTFKTQLISHKSLIKDKQEELERNNSENTKKCTMLGNEMQKIQQQLVNLDTENTSYKRQNNRLQDENEKLINQLDELEKQIDALNKLGLEQQQHLLELEKKSETGEPNVDVEKILQQLDNTKTSLEISLAEKQDLLEKCESLNNVIDAKSLENIKIKEEIELIKSDMDKISNNLVANEAKLSEVEKLYDIEKIKKDKLNTRLKSYKEKLLKCNFSIDQLKKSKSVLLKTVTDYSESVPKWQNDILNASKLLSEQLLQLESENSDLKNKLSNMESNTDNSETNEKVNNLSNENILLGLKLNSLTDEIALVKDENMNLKGQLKTLTIDYEQLCSNVKSLESEKNILVNEKKSAKETIQKNENEKSELKSMLDDLNSNIVRYKSEIQQLKNNIDSIEAEKHLIMNQLENAAKPKVIKTTLEQTALQTLKDELVSLKCGLVSIEEENKLLRESNENLKSQMEASAETQTTPEMRNLMEQNDMLQTDISKMQNKLMTYKNENSSLHTEVKECRQKLADVENMSQDYESMKSKFSNYKSENAELLKEMKEINQVLKERGETISKQYMEINELNSKSQAMEEEMKKLKEGSDKKDEEIKKYLDVIKELDEQKEKNKSLLNEMDNLESLLKERDGIIISLQDDYEKMKQNQGNISYDGPSDNLSVSTMSRVEETSRLKDLDDSFEERYSKLRTLAIKLRKRVNELILENKNLEESSLKREQEKIEMMNRLERIESSNVNVSVQNENMIVVEKKDAEPSNDTINSLTKALEFNKMEKASLNMALKELQSQLSSLKTVNEELKAKEAECLKFKDTLALKESQLALEVSQHQITKDFLEKAKKEVKKKSVLSLEMEDYERSMKELTGKMEEDKKKIVQMESTIDTQQATISSLKTQIKMLEDQLNSEEKSLKEFKDLLNKSTDVVKENENVISIKNDVILKLERELEDNKLQYEDLNLQLASALGSKEKCIMTFEQEKSDLISKCKINEGRYVEIEEKLKLKSIELDELRTEFAGYKVRAQSVLRQNNKKDLSLEENLKEEMAALKAEIESLKTECENWKSELENIQSERNRLVNRCNELQSTITAAHSERESIAEQYSVLLQKEIQEQKNIKLQMTTLTQCYKKQITELEESTSDQIAKLKKELEFSRASIARVSISKDNNIDRKPLQFVAINSISEIDDNKVSHDLSENMNEINVSLLEREEGEGSESTPAPSPTSSNKMIRHNHRGKREPMPLDQLLETGILEDGPETYSEGDIELQLNTALKQIEMRDKRLAHLTELVAEAEKEVARRSQLVETLKEEVRRCQRALDRGHHHHNQEYLKNVIVKFLTLNAGDERSRLVPVLNTILTLSPDETNQLNAAARGLDPNANRSWGSYLPWPGGR